MKNILATVKSVLAEYFVTSPMTNTQDIQSVILVLVGVTGRRELKVILMIAERTGRCMSFWRESLKHQ